MYHKIVSLKLKSVIFSQNDWQEVSGLLKKKPTCFRVGFLVFFGIMQNSQTIDLIKIIKINFA